MSMDVRFSSPYTALVVLASRKRFVSDYTYKHFVVHGPHGTLHNLNSLYKEMYKFRCTAKNG